MKQITKLPKSEINTVKNSEGAYVCSAIVNNQYIHIRYYGYTKSQAVKAFQVEYQEKLRGL